ncbi:MAG: DUF4382 domain-containing protein [Terracidiphilus sp.]
MSKAFSSPFAAILVALLLTGCGSTSTTTSSATGAAVPVSLSMTDDPPTGVSVLFFQVSLTAASLTPASGPAVSLLSNDTPIEIDVTQLQALSAFLSTAGVPAGTYDSLSLTFADPQLVIYNASDTAIASTCAVGSVCQLTPTVDNSATVSLSAAPFPVTVAANSPLGFLVDFHLNTIIQSDLSVNLQAANGVTVGQLPPTAPVGPARFGSVTGTVQSVNASQNQFTVQTAWGRTFTVDASSSTLYDDFPASDCSTGSISCLATGQVVRVQVSSLESAGTLLASQVTFLETAGQQTVEGTIIGIQEPAANNTNAPWTIRLILQNNPSNSTALPLGGEATVTLASGATYSVDAGGFTLPSSLSFSGASDLYVGQNVQVDVVSGSLSASSVPSAVDGWGPARSLSFTTDSVVLEPSQMSGSVSAIDAGTLSFTLNRTFMPQCWSFVCAMPIVDYQYDAQTTAQTVYSGFGSGNDDFAGLADEEIVSVNGWLFPPASGSSNPVLVPETIALHANRYF